MSRKRRPPQARDRMLGLHLRAHRHEAGLSMEAAAREARVSLATMSRVESGKRHITTEDVAALLAVYRVDPVRRAELMAAARGAHRPAWWVDRADGHPPEVFDVCAAGAHAVTEFSLTAVPPALHTRRYALAHLRASGIPDTALDAAWSARTALQRTRTLIDQTYFLHESALDTPYGGPGALREQLHHLRDAPDRGVTVRLIPRRAPLAQLTHGWTAFDYTDATPVVYIELQGGALFLHHPVTTGYLDTLAHLRTTAYTVTETRAHLHDLAGTT